MMDVIAWISQICFMLCGLPLAISAYRNRSIRIDLAFILLWTIGEVTGIIYAVHLGELPLLTNYLINSVFLGVVWYYREGN